MTAVTFLAPVVAWLALAVLMRRPRSVGRAWVTHEQFVRRVRARWWLTFPGGPRLPSANDVPAGSIDHMRCLIAVDLNTVNAWPVPPWRRGEWTVEIYAERA